MATTLTILQGDRTITTWVELAISGYGADTQMQFKNGLAGTYSDPEPIRDRKHWELPRSNGNHEVYVKTLPSTDEDSAIIEVDAVEMTDALHADLSSIYERSDPILDAILGALAAPFGGVYEMTLVGAAQQNILSSRGYHLDVWGNIYRVPRRTGEADAAYAERIIAEIVSPKLTGLALVLAVKALILTNPENLVIREYDGYPFRLTVDVTGCDVFDADEIRRTVRRLKAFGVKASLLEMPT